MNLNLLTTFGISQDSKQGMRNPWVIGIVGLLLFVIAVNVGFITMAMKTNPGLVDSRYYDRGRDHEKNVLKKIAARNALGLEANFEVPEHIVMAQPTAFRFTAIDKRGLPFSKAEINVVAYRPADASADFTVLMQDNSDGRYQADLNFPLKGTWDLILKVKRGEDIFELSHRITVHQT